MDVRNRDELLRKQEKLEAYLLENPKSSLFAWYARQNMEAGELDRALKICRLGLEGASNTGVIHKLMGEIYMAKGEVTRSMKHMVECLLTKDPFPGVIIEVMKNFSDTLAPDQMIFLIYLLNRALPGHPYATAFYDKNPEAREFKVKPDQYKFLETLALNLEHSAQVELLPEEEEIIEELAPPVEAPQVEAPPVEAVAEEAVVEAPVEEIPVEEIEDHDAFFKPPSAPVEDPFNIPEEPDPEMEAEPDLEPETPAPVVPEVEVEPPPPPPKRTPPMRAAPKRRPAQAQSPVVKHNVTRSMATFTLMQIFKSQGMYENALEVLQLLREKSSNIERIDNEEKEILELLAKNDLKQT